LQAVKLLLDVNDVDIVGKGDAQPLSLACSLAHVEIAKLLVLKGASVNGCSAELPALHYACSSGNPQPLIEFLLEYYVDINSVPVQGMSALHMLCINRGLGSQALIKSATLLLDAGIDRTIKANGQTAADRALLRGARKLYQFLTCAHKIA
jgi:ankyrin repeat protein